MRNENVVATTKDWLKATEGMEITAYYPGIGTGLEYIVAIEPDQAVNLSAAERARMNRANPGIHTVPDSL